MKSDRWYADGQIHGEDYEFASFLGSKMNQRGVTCLDCHNPNSVKRDTSRQQPVHEMPQRRIHQRASHQPGGAWSSREAGAGSECVGCHMPVTVYMQRHPRHDHGFTIPDPLLTKEWNIPNACDRCHADKPVDWAIEYADKWYGAKMNRPTRDRARMIASAQKGEDKARLQMVNLLTNGQQVAYWRAVVAGLLWQWADRPEVKAALLARLKDSSPLVREKAAKSLESLVDSKDAETLQALKPMLEDSSRNVRRGGGMVNEVERECKKPGRTGIASDAGLQRRSTSRPIPQGHV